MKTTLYPLRMVFIILCMTLFFTLASTTSWLGSDTPLTTSFLGGMVGLFVSIVLILGESMAPKASLGTMNTLTLGVFFGYLLGQTFVWAFQALPLSIEPTTEKMITLTLLLVGLYWGSLLAFRATREFSFSIPFLQWQNSREKKRLFLLDFSTLADPRIVDFAVTGFLDRAVVVPRFLLIECHLQMKNGDEIQKLQAKKAYEGWKKLNTLPHFALHTTDQDFPEAQETKAKLFLLAYAMHAYILTAETGNIPTSEIDEEIRIVHLNDLAKALQPPKQYGEFLSIKVQRYGKEPRQGVGYLEDGTMVVVNGGAEYLGQTIRVQVLSVKHTSSGRMIFSNASHAVSEKGGYTPSKTHSSLTTSSQHIS